MTESHHNCFAGQPNGSSTAFTTGLTGTYHFKADGTGEVTSQSLSILFPEPGVDIPDASVFTRIPSTFHYTMGADGESFTFPSGGSFSSTVTTGPRVGELSTITNTPGFTGWIGDGAKELLLTNVNPSVETQTYTGPPGPILPATFYRICHISKTLVRLPHAPRFFAALGGCWPPFFRSIFHRHRDRRGRMARR
jgi:hypothetical protein